MNLDFINKNDAAYKALESAIYCPPYKEENAIETIELNEFDIDKVKEQIRKSVALLSYNKKYRPLIIEIMDILDQNRDEFLLDQQKYISFYWNGILILRLIMNKDVKHDKQLHVSLQKYASEKDQRIADNKMSRIILFGLTGSLLLGGIVTGLALWKRSNY